MDLDLKLLGQTTRTLQGPLKAVLELSVVSPGLLQHMEFAQVGILNLQISISFKAVKAHDEYGPHLITPPADEDHVIRLKAQEHILNGPCSRINS